MQKKQLGIYVHIPFCVQKCRYCDFLSFPRGENSELQYREYVQAVCSELYSYNALAEEYEVRTIYFGGGTPSLLDAALIGQIMEEIRNGFSVLENAEITIECNPGTTDYTKFVQYREQGCNRLSLGLQSTNEELLKRLGRIHSFRDFQIQYEEAEKAGFDNINVDLMSALPGETLELYEKDLQEVIALCPEHISSYGLILEEGTPFYRDRTIRDMLPREEQAVEMYERTLQRLSKAGYHRYEISNYSLPGRESRHNSSYWTGVSYLGIGLGASSYLADWKEGRYTRFQNESDFHTYMGLWREPGMGSRERFERAQSYWKETEELTVTDRMEEFMFLGLRMMHGVSREEFQRRFGREMEQVYGPVIKKYKEQGLLSERIEQKEHYISLTKAGILVSNPIFADFML
ncbi:MAG: radical SAM family heme chaperone HemW [Lachnospiraceae bacterium]|nr:radical SAM family heme chaperone HemW [Lachnospiraceae bacterium]